MSFSIKIFGAVALMCIGAIPVWAQRFNGTVVDTGGNPCANAVVTFSDNFNPSVRSSAVTDDLGQYKISLPNGKSDDLLYAEAIVDKPSKILNFAFAVKKSTKINVSVVDLSGRQTVSVFSQLCNAGEYRFSWNYGAKTNCLDNRIYLVNFQSSDNAFTQKFVQNGVSRMDFYSENTATEDLESANAVDRSYTATIEGDGFSTHVARHVTSDTEIRNFIVNKSSWAPFKCGQTFFGQYDGDKYVPFYVKGINLGAAIPGTSPAEMAPTADQYARWFELMSEMGYNLIRIYTLHYPRFYQELKKFNEAHPQSPIYLMHGAWLDEEYEGFDGNADLFTSKIWFVRDVNQSTELESQTITEYFDNRIREVVDVVHGNTTLPERWGWASGQYTADVSPWLLGFIVGREIYANEVNYTNLNNPALNSYNGKVFSLTDVKASEVWATQRLDNAMAYEQESYGEQHPVSFSSWPTLDPIDHPTENGPEDMVSLNLDGMDESNSPAGYFASYHVYPYFPDFMVCDPGYREYTDDMGENSYLGYLNDLKSHYPNRPLIISEFGVSSSWGTTRFSSNGMHHGGLTEKQQGEYVVRMMNNIRDANCGGGILFSWIDEWFKYVWIFGQTTNPETRSRWHNIYSAEDNYGLISFIPEEADYSGFGYSSRSEKIDQVRMASDVEGLYVKVKLNRALSANDTLWLALDTYNSGKGESILPNKQVVKNRAEFCVSITPTEAQLYVTKAYDLYGIGQEGYPKAGQYFRSVPSDGEGWNLVKWKNHRDENFCAGSVFQSGRLRIRDNKNPIRSDAVIIDNKEVVVKLPWGMINFNDPSQLKVVHITDYKLNGGTNFKQTEDSDGVAVTVSMGGSKVNAPRYVWAKWDEASMPKTVEYRKSSFYIVKKALKSFAGYVAD